MGSDTGMASAEYDPQNQVSLNLTSYGSPNQATWGEELRAYERTKRFEVHPRSFEGTEFTIQRGAVSAAERDFNPITQRFRDRRLEQDLRKQEKEMMVEHSNRAQDIQILREQTHNIIHNGSRLNGIEEASSPSKNMKTQSGKWPDTRADYNIISNLGVDVHHYAPPGERPMPPVRIPRARERPAYLIREFNPVTNRYLEHHDEKSARDTELAKLEAAMRHRHQNRFNPVTQRFVDQDQERSMQAADTAHEQEMMRNREIQECPSSKHRPTAYYNPVNHEHLNEEMLKWMDLAEDERKLRYRQKYFVEHDLHNRDLAEDHQHQQRKLNRVSIKRFKTQIERGHDIITNHQYRGRDGVPAFVPYPEEAEPMWKQAMIRNGVDHSYTKEANLGTEVLKRLSARGETSVQASPSHSKPSHGISHSVPETPGASPAQHQHHNRSGSMSLQSSPSKSKNAGLALSARGPAGPPAASPAQSRRSGSVTARLPERVQHSPIATSGVAPPAPAIPGESRAGSVYSHRL